MSRHLKAVDGNGEIVKGQSKYVRNSFTTPETLSDYLADEAARQGITKSRFITELLAEHKQRHYGAGSTFEIQSSDTHSYDRRKFYPGSQDKHGHSTTIRVNVPKPLAARGRAFIASGAVPQLRSIEGLIRDGFVHRIHELSMMVDNGELLETVTLTMLRDEEQQLAEQREEADGLLQDMADNIKAYRDRGAWMELAAYLDQRAGMDSLIPESHKDEFEELMADARKLVKRRTKR